MKIGMLTLNLYNRQKTTNNYSFSGEKQQKPLTPKQKQLVEKNLALVGFVMSPRFLQSEGDPPVMQNIKLALKPVMDGIKDHDDYEKYESAGNEGLVMAAINYDKNPKASFSTYACYWIAGTITKEFEKNNRFENRFVNLDQPIGYEKVSSYYSIIEDKNSISPVENAISNEEKMQLERIYDALYKIRTTDRNRLIFYMGYKQEKTLQSIADIWGVTKERVRQIQIKMIKKINNVIQVEDAEEAREARDNRILEKFRAGMPEEKIAEQEKLSCDYIHQILGNNQGSIADVKEKRRVLDKEMEDAINILEMSRDGETPQEIADKTGYPLDKVSRILDEYKKQ